MGYVGGHLADRRQLLGAAECLPQREDPMVVLHDFLVAHAQLFGRGTNPFLKGHLMVLQFAEHLVKAVRNRADLIASSDVGPRREIPLAGACHGVANVRQRAMNQPSRQDIDHQRGDDDRGDGKAGAEESPG